MRDRSGEFAFETLGHHDTSPSGMNGRSIPAGQAAPAGQIDAK
ncbi:hypothetical protein Ga0080574_TMP3819 [Salipiger abyssi]|uniref:Uncharacterized protein n=1 Tax=Salipiger abyssi TaxID=1250539 RepID=A0A1P8UXP5_9RHOB|nr:hypothetical protein Ga0080574_TMP3819 [Salipiger abyssi]